MGSRLTFAILSSVMCILACFGLNHPYLPNEKVYLHLDNTSYYQGDEIFFKAYVVNSCDNADSSISNTLYVELLTPGGETYERKIFKLENGQAHGALSLSKLPFYSGFYEIRVYTKYMLNFGEDAIYSRVVPIFDYPEHDGDFENRKLIEYGKSKFAYIRKKPQKNGAFNVVFYPEGGHLVKNLQSRCAFEITDKKGEPIDAKGKIMINGNVEGELETTHRGKGIFLYTPTKDKAAVSFEHEGKEYFFNLPDASDDGYTLQVDNISDRKKIKVRVQRFDMEGLKDTVNISLISNGQLKDYVVVTTNFKQPLDVFFNQNQASDGVSDIVVTDNKDRIVASRSIFKFDKSNLFDIKYTFDKTNYKPFEEMVLSLHSLSHDSIPMPVPFSLSVRDGHLEVPSKHNILTDMLLASEVKGYIRNPSYYFESDDYEHRRDLDLLMMVQSWKNYPDVRHQLADVNTAEFLPESNGIDIKGTVSAFNVKRPKANVEVSLLLTKGEPADSTVNQPVLERFITDSLGSFRFTANLEGDYDMILAITKNNKKKNYSIALDRQFQPAPRRYFYNEISLPGEEGLYDSGEADKSVVDTFIVASSFIKEKSIMLREVEVKAKRTSGGDEIYQAHKGSSARYDVGDGIDKVLDTGGFFMGDLNKFLCRINPNFMIINDSGEDYLFYRFKLPLVVVDYEVTYMERQFQYQDIPLEWIKTVYINENPSEIMKYCDPRMSKFSILKYFSCVVFVETIPEDKRPVDTAIGVRRTKFHGYDTPVEFYSPDYSVATPLQNDYRRTLYWNPDVKPDANGNITLRFFNNSTPTHPIVDAQTVSSSGIFGLSKQY